MSYFPQPWTGMFVFYPPGYPGVHHHPVTFPPIVYPVIPMFMEQFYRPVHYPHYQPSDQQPEQSGSQLSNPHMNTSNVPRFRYALPHSNATNSCEQLANQPPEKIQRNRQRPKHTCIYCGKDFTKPASLKVHLRTHTRSQPYTCEYCQRSFSVCSNLKRHIRNVHKGEKVFNCARCERKFSQKGNLERHLKSHEDDDGDVLEVD